MKRRTRDKHGNKIKRGISTSYVSRKKALKKLQLSLKDFRRLCILKGIFPHQPPAGTNLNGQGPRIFYYSKDINFLAQEPIINKFREYKVFLRKLNHYKAKRDGHKIRKLHENKPKIELDHVVKERYPTFVAAVRDLDDALCVCWGLALLPTTNVLRSNLLEACRRRVLEFAHWVIEARALTKAFISIKGIYFEAQVAGERVTWIVAHERAIGHTTEVDFAVMSTFAEFYTAALRFINFRLYQERGLFYPPRIHNIAPTKLPKEQDETVDWVAALARPILRNTAVKSEEVEAEGGEEEDFDAAEGEDDAEIARRRAARARRRLFDGFVFWLNREVPKEACVLVIRSCGGTVSWDGCPGSALEENSPEITHQIVDRPMDKFDLSRTYVQPQWIFDSLNLGKRLPSGPYAPGATLPPHFSPFEDERPGDYVSVERLAQLELQGVDTAQLALNQTPGAVTIEQAEQIAAKKSTEKEKKLAAKTARTEGKMAARRGTTHTPNAQTAKNEEGAELRRRESMLTRKTARIYKRMKRSEQGKQKTANKLAAKRRKIDQDKGKTATATATAAE